MVSIPSYNTHIATYDPIATISLTSTAADITFSNIPQVYKDLVVVLIGTVANTGGGWTAAYAQINGDTGNNYSNTNIYGDGSTVVSNRLSSTSVLYSRTWANSDSTGIRPSTMRLQFQSYTNTNVFKTVLGETSGDLYTNRFVSLWRSTSAITTLKFYPAGSNWSAGFKASLYGIKGEL